MRVIWTDEALVDLYRLHDFLAEEYPRTADRVVNALVQAPNRLLQMPRLGQRVEHARTEEIRHIFVGNYEFRYELLDEVIYVLNIWHERENR